MSIRSRDNAWSESDHFNVLIAGYVDGVEPLEEADVLLQLCHGLLQPDLMGFLCRGLNDERQALELLMHLIPVFLKGLERQ